MSEKSSKIKDLFDKVSSSYDLMNDVMSLGIHRLWKNKLVQLIPQFPYIKILDLGGGTADISLRYWQKHSNLAPHITIIDPSEEMMEQGRNKAINNNIWNLNWVQGAGENIPFKDNHFDVCTMAFSLRNASDIPKVVQETYRVLKPGGKFLCLEFSQVSSDIQQIYTLYTLEVLPRIGKWITQNENAYRYLGESIQNFYEAEELKKIMEKFGFKHVNITKLSKGIVAIHQGWKE